MPSATIQMELGHFMAFVDIVIPTYKRAILLPETLSSVQQQTFADWRCFVAEDGQTVETSAAVAPFLKDSRFLYLPGRHCGTPAGPRNRAIRQGSAPLIAFLDDDDLWLPEKLDVQMQFMEKHPGCVLLGANAYRWNGKCHSVIGSSLFFSKPPAGRIGFKTLAAVNFIINSTALIRRKVLSVSGLLNEDPRLASFEDYDLWLRIAALGEVWFQDRALAIYRDVLEESIRRGLAPHIHARQLARVFSTALHGSRETPSPLSRPENKAFASVCRRRCARLRLQEMEQGLRRVLRIPDGLGKQLLLAAGRMVGRVIGLWLRHAMLPGRSIFMIFPFYHTGGAERVHADIIRSLRDYRPHVFIVNKSNNTAFLNAFAQNAKLYNIEHFCRLREICFLVIGCLAEFINRAGTAAVFGCNTGFFYELLPLLKKDIKKIDLIHAFGGGLEETSLPCVPLLDARVVINKMTVADFARLYAENGIAPDYMQRIHVIENRVAVSETLPEKSFDIIRVLYVGRGTAEKRVYLVGKIARMCTERNPLVTSTLIGDVADSVCPEDLPYCRLMGEILDDAQLDLFYSTAHFILLTSSREGFPLVLMEAMAHGVVPVTTNVGGISTHIVSGFNGILIDEIDEDLITEEFVGHILDLAADNCKYRSLSLSAHRYAKKHFCNPGFAQAYRNLFLG